MIPAPADRFGAAARSALSTSAAAALIIRISYELVRANRGAPGVDGVKGTINAPVTVTINTTGSMDPQQVASLARAEIERAQRRQLDQIRRGLYD